MAHVRFKSSAFIGGHRFAKGIQEVPENFLDRLPSSAKPIADREAQAELKRQADAEAALRSPKTLKEMRSGRMSAKPMGKAQASDPTPPTTDQDDLLALRKAYTDATGKKAFGGWKADELEQRIAEAKPGS